MTRRYPAQRAYRQRHRATGRCLDCRAAADPPFQRCATHRANNLVYQRRYYVSLQILRALGT